MKIILALLVLINVMPTNASAKESITSQCNSIIRGNTNEGPSTDILVAKYRKMCSDLAKQYDLTAQDLEDSECNSQIGSPWGARPSHGYQCLQARFGEVSITTSNKNNSSVKCKITDGKNFKNVLAAFEIPLGGEVEQTVNMYNTQWTLHGGYFHSYIDFSASLVSNPDKNLYGEGFYAVRAEGAVDNYKLSIVCGDKYK